MQIKDYLKTYQPIVYQTLSNAFKNGTVSHAYLIYGEKGTPLFETAKYLGKSILCDDPNPLACEECITCHRVTDNNYPDFLIFDGSEESVKKDDMANLEVEFSKTPLEKKGKKIYIINQIENMTVQALNAILKFLEEPGKDIYAFLTTNNIASILPTIVSRCQTIKILPINRKLVVKEATQNEVDVLDAELLASISNQVETIIEISESDNYKSAKSVLLKTLDILESEDKNEIYYELEKLLLSISSKKETVKLYFALLLEVFEDMLASSYNGDVEITSLESEIVSLKDKVPHLKETVIDLLKINKDIQQNLNINLLIDHMIFSIIKE